MLLRPGEAFGRYEVAGLLGRGAMGEVYRARDTILHRDVALKILTYSTPADEASPGSETPRIVREARAAAALTHPNAVSVYDVGESNGVPFLAMELVAGKTLRALIGDAAQPMERRLRWLVDVARALGAAHRLGLIHRDVKPENVMVRDDGFVKVLDFGIARWTAERSPESAGGDGDAATLAAIAAASASQTMEGAVMGTPLYMAPEQLRGDVLDGRTDQFAWGVLAYEVLTGSAPWQGHGTHALLEILSKDPAPLVAANAEIPASVNDVVQKTLRKDPGERFATMELVIDALEELTGSVAKASDASRRREATARGLQLITWNDLFILVDEGRAGPADYLMLGEIVLAEAARHRGGIGGLTIIPPDAKPPSEEVRKTIHDVLGRLGGSIRCNCWFVEGAGFHAAMVRGVLTGLRVFGRLPYESHVSSDMAEAIAWVMERLDGSDRRRHLVPDVVTAIEAQRRLSRGDGGAERR